MSYKSNKGVSTLAIDTQKEKVFNAHDASQTEQVQHVTQSKTQEEVRQNLFFTDLNVQI